MSRAALLLTVVLAACSGGTGSLGDDDFSSPDDDDTTAADDDDFTPADDDDACEGQPSVPGTDIDLELVTGSVDMPVLVTHAGDGSGRLFIVEQSGRIRSWSSDEGLGTWLDLRADVTCCGERGLLAVAFHPDFASNGRAFLYYTETDGQLTTVISELLVSGDPTSDPPDEASEMVLLTESEPAGNHNGGALAFGPDGYLYVGLGDGGGSGDTYGNGQRKDTFHAKILRIDVDGTGAGEFGNYAIPADNPFVDDASHRPETWAWGLRNPWRFSFDRGTGDLWIGDVGQNQWEELDLGVAGANYGWPQMEGNHCYSSGCDPSLFEPAVYEYNHAVGVSITGGHVYRGCLMEDLRGVYFYADYNYWNSPIWSLVWDGESMQEGPVDIAVADVLVSSFGEDEQGELYVCDHIAGGVYRIVPVGR